MENQMGRLGGGGAQAVLEIQVEGGGQKNVPSIGGAGFFLE